MKSMNRKESKKIAVMATVIMGLMVFAFMPLASAGVTSFTVTPSTGLAGVVDSYNALVTTDGVTTINITIPAGFIAVTPTTGGVLIAEVNFWNSTSKAYYGYATIKSSNTNPTTKVDVVCKLGGETATKTQDVDYTAGETSTFESGFACDTSSAIIKLPTVTENGSINITINYTGCPGFNETWRLDDVHISIKQFVRNPATADDYVFSADGVDATVTITAPSGHCAIWRNGVWYVDSDGNHIADLYYWQGIAGDTPLIGDFNNDGTPDIAVWRTGIWYIDTNLDNVPDMWLFQGIAGDIPLVGDINSDGKTDIAVFRAGVWYVDTNLDNIIDMWIWYGIAGDTPLIGDFNSDGNNDIAVWRNGIWYIDTTVGPIGIADMWLWQGIAGDKPLVGNFNSDGKTDIAVFRAGVWYVDTNLDNIIDMWIWYGIAGDTPLIWGIC